MKVLVVDDDESVRRLFKFMLRQGGHEGVFAADLRAARQAIADLAECALLVTDHKLPDGDGFAAARLFREKFPRSRMLLASGAVDVDELLAQSGAAGFAGILRKPFDPDEALTQIQAVLGGPA